MQGSGDGLVLTGLERKTWTSHPAFVVAILALFGAVIRGQVLGYPLIHIDEQFYLLVGDAMLHGSRPFIDVWDRKPIGLFLIYALSRLMGGDGIWQYQLLALLSVTATAYVISRIATRFASPMSALAAAALYIVWLDIGSGSGGQAPVFYNLPMAVAALFIVRSIEQPVGSRMPRLIRSGSMAMLLVGLAMQIKYTAVFEGAGFGLALLWFARGEGARPSQIIGAGAVWIACAILPTAIALLTYAAIGGLDAFMFANFYSIFQRAAATAGEIPLRLARLCAFVAPLAFLGLAPTVKRADASALLVRRFVKIWFGVACFGVLAFGTYFRHYALPIFLPGAIASATAFDSTARIRRLAFGILAIAIIIGQLMLAELRRTEGSPDMLNRLVIAMQGHPGCLFVHKGHPILYLMSNRCRLSRYWMPAHFSKANESGALGINIANETRRILSLKPGLIVTTLPVRPSDNLETRAIMEAGIARDYQLVYQERAGRTVHQLFALRDAGRKAAASIPRPN